MSATESAKAAIDTAEAVKDTADVTASAASAIAGMSSVSDKDVLITQAVDGVQAAGKAYEKISSRTAGGIMDKLFGGVASLFTGLKKVTKDIEEGGGPKILP